MLADHPKRAQGPDCRVIVLDENLTIQAERHTFERAFSTIDAGIVQYVPGVTGIQIDPDNEVVSCVDQVGAAASVQAQVVNPIVAHRATGSAPGGWLAAAAAQRRYWRPPMPAILSVTIPFFALVLAGYLAAHRHVLPESAIPGLNAFVLYFALPCMLFRFGAGTAIFELLNPVVLGVYVACALLIVFFTLAVTLRAPVHLKDAAFGALVAAFPNTGFMGVPLLVALLGPAAAGPMMTVLLADLFVTSSLCIALAQAHDAAGHGARKGALRALRGALSNPLPWSIALGAAFSVAGWQLPGPADTAVRMLADAASPVALFTIGAVLHRAGQHVHARTPPGRYLPVAAIKLVLHPLLVFLLATSAHGLGLPLSTFQVAVMTLAAALPSASNVSLLAERFGADNGRVARIIMSSTVFAFVTFPLLAWLFGARP